MNLQQLYYFRTVAELKHFTKAATKLMVSQPSLSHAINELEVEFGVCLFERSSRSVALTKYGEIFLEYVEESLRILDEGQKKLYDFIDPMQGTVGLSYVSSLESFVQYIVARFYSDMQQVRTVFQFYQQANADIKGDLLSGKSDLGIGTYIEDQQLVSKKIGEHELVLIVNINHPLAKHDSVDLAVLNEEKFIIYDKSCDIRSYINKALDVVGASPEISLEAIHDNMIYSSVAANYGVAMVPAPLGLYPHYVKPLKIENELPKREIFLTWKNMHYISPAVSNFRDFLLAQHNILEEYKNEILKAQ